MPRRLPPPPTDEDDDFPDEEDENPLDADRQVEAVKEGMRGFFQDALGGPGFGDPRRGRDPTEMVDQLNTAPVIAGTDAMEGAQAWLIEKRNEATGQADYLGTAPLKVSYAVFIRRFLPSMPNRGDDPAQFYFTPIDKSGAKVGALGQPHVVNIPWDNVILREIRSAQPAQTDPVLGVVQQMLEEARRAQAAAESRAAQAEAAARLAQADAVKVQLSHSAQVANDVTAAYQGVAKTQSDLMTGVLTTRESLEREARARRMEEDKAERERRDEERKAADAARQSEIAQRKIEADARVAELKAEAEARVTAMKAEADARLQEARLAAQLREKEIEAKIKAEEGRIESERLRMAQERAEALARIKEEADERRRERQEAEQRWLEAQRREDDRRKDERDREEARRKDERDAEAARRADEEKRRNEFALQMETIRKDARKDEADRAEAERRRQDEHARMMLGLIEKQKGDGGGDFGVFGKVLDALNLSPGDALEKAKEFLGGGSLGQTIAQGLLDLGKEVVKRMPVGDGEEEEEEEEEEEQIEERKPRQITGPPKLPQSVPQRKATPKVAEPAEPPPASSASATVRPREPSSGAAIPLALVREGRQAVDALVERLEGADPDVWSEKIMDGNDVDALVRYVQRVGLRSALDDTDVDPEKVGAALVKLGLFKEAPMLPTAPEVPA
jgi:hypothetical protein